MFWDVFAEVGTSMSRNKLRIALTGFSIAWGIFMLIVLLGAGNGLIHGVMNNYGSSPMNIITLYPGRTTQPYKGLQEGRKITLNAQDIQFLLNNFPDKIISVSPKISTSATIVYNKEFISGRVIGISPSDIRISEDNQVIRGRDFNETDIKERRKVCILGEKNLEVLFPDGRDPIGLWVKIGEIPFRVIGVYHSTNSFGTSESVYIPQTTCTAIFAPDGHYSSVALWVKNINTIDENETFVRNLRSAMGRYKSFEASDRSALWIGNVYEEYQNITTLFSTLKLFIWIIGLATLIAGIVGISNIMLITVRERTREFGIRKALGASPASIVSLVMLESVGVTVLFGYIGMLLGIGLTQLVSTILSMSATEGDMTVFLNPTVDLGVIITATLVMILAGMISGYIPAKRAVSIKPVEALAAQ